MKLVFYRAVRHQKKKKKDSSVSRMVLSSVKRKKAAGVIDTGVGLTVSYQVVRKGLWLECV